MRLSRKAIPDKKSAKFLRKRDIMRLKLRAGNERVKIASRFSVKFSVETIVPLPFQLPDTPIRSTFRHSQTQCPRCGKAARAPENPERRARIESDGYCAQRVITSPSAALIASRCFRVIPSQKRPFSANRQRPCFASCIAPSRIWYARSNDSTATPATYAASQSVLLQTRCLPQQVSLRRRPDRPTR